jgi:hypothetical protein
MTGMAQEPFRSTTRCLQAPKAALEEELAKRRKRDAALTDGLKSL